MDIDYNALEEYSGTSYAEAIRTRWLEILDLSIQFRIGLMIHDDNGKTIGCNPDLAREYIARLSRLWLELCPKVEQKPEFDVSYRDGATNKFTSLKNDFLEFRQYSANPSLFFKDTKDAETFDENKLFRLEEILRKVLEKLELTRF